MKKNLLISLFVLTCLITSCNKDRFNLDPNIANNLSKINLGNNIPQTELNIINWEEGIYAPINLNNGTGHGPRYPWISQSWTSIPGYIVYSNNHPQSEGWRLFANSFDNTQFPYIALYNKYTGTLRFFVYGMKKFEKNKLFASLRYRNTVQTTTLLNNAKPQKNEFNHYKEITKRESYVNIVQTPNCDYNIINNELMGGGYISSCWHIFDFELSYDENFVYNNNEHFEFSLYGYNESKIKMNGNLKGKITGTINGAINNGGSSLIGSIPISITDNSSKNKLIINNLKKAETKNKGFFKGLMTKAIGTSQNLIGKKLGSVVAGIVNSGISWMAGPIGGMFTNLLGLGGEQNNVQKVDLGMDAKMEFTGKFTQNYELSGNHYIPIHKIYKRDLSEKEALGAWRIEGTAEINQKTKSVNYIINGQLNSDKGYTQTTLKIVKPKIIVNPSISKYVVKKEIDCYVEENYIVNKNDMNPYSFKNNKCYYEIHNNLTLYAQNALSGISLKTYMRAKLTLNVNGKKYILIKDLGVIGGNEDVTYDSVDGGNGGKHPEFGDDDDDLRL